MVCRELANALVPVQRPTKVELVVNLQTAKTLCLTRGIENDTMTGERGMFESFEEALINVATVFTRRKGNGPPLLLLHGFPETHLMWHAVAPRLADTFTVVCADLRGYGASGKPASTPNHAPYAKSAMARDMVRRLFTFQRSGA